ncbi:MAG: hypothetical protein ACOH2S_06055 [Janthinobacterium svalbardensis]|uniref:hypothetical protein n=1 Tax=Janthinobacterium svalbardensis TaxID=368607 RepID=UPI00142DCEBB|nr:hypothetical protein [Janthinobacterium svalbardensis]
MAASLLPELVAWVAFAISSSSEGGGGGGLTAGAVLQALSVNAQATAAKKWNVNWRDMV